MSRALGILGCLLLFSPAPVRSEDCADLGRTFSRWFLTGAVDTLWQRMSPQMQAAVHGVEGLQGMSRQVSDQAGRQTEVLSETCVTTGPFRTYTRLSRFERRPGTITIQWTWEPRGTIVSGFVRPTPEPAPSSFMDYQTKTKLRLPFHGAWYVFWGGRTFNENYHVIARDQRFAYDFVQRKEGVTHSGDGKTNEQYYGFGQVVLAPGPGTVAAAVDSLPDNKPGVRDPNHPFGNHMILDHGNGEFSVLAHLQRGSVRARGGQTVAAGDTIGHVGNSGNTSEPHLHFHIQNRGAAGLGEGLPAFFTSYTADGAAVGRGEPKRGQTVEPR